MLLTQRNALLVDTSYGCLETQNLTLCGDWAGSPSLQGALSQVFVRIRMHPDLRAIIEAKPEGRWYLGSWVSGAGRYHVIPNDSCEPQG